MIAAIEPVTICEEFVYQTLSADAALDGLIGADNIWPAFAPVDVTTMHLTHDFTGPAGGIAATPLDGGLALLTLFWDITAWTPGLDRQVLRPVAKRVQEILTGTAAVGKRFLFTSVDGSVWAIACRYGGPIVVAADINPTWQRVAARYVMELRQCA
jgi:hypothetical protein